MPGTRTIEYYPILECYWETLNIIFILAGSPRTWGWGLKKESALMALSFEWRVQILDAKYWLAEIKWSASSRLCQLPMQKKSKTVASDVLLRKTRDKLCDFPINFEGRPKRCSAFFITWTRCPRCLGFSKSFIFQALVIAVEMERETLQIALVFCPLQSIIKDQISEARNMGFSASSVAD